MLTRGGTVRLQIHSNFDMLDFVQMVSDRMPQLAGLDEDAVALDWRRRPRVGHQRHQARQPRGRQEARDGRVRVRARRRLRPSSSSASLDRARGSSREEIADPLAPENLLKSSGRGIFFMRSFMDDVTLRRGPEGGMEVRMVKKLSRRSLIAP